MDDFGIKYIGKENLQHLYDALRKETYKIVEDLEGDLYCGIALKWNFAKHHVDLVEPMTSTLVEILYYSSLLKIQTPLSPKSHW